MRANTVTRVRHRKQVQDILGGIPICDENDLIHSPRQQHCTFDDQAIEPYIYRMPDSDWNLGLVDQHGKFTVWNGVFGTDQEAFDCFLSDLKKDGIDAFIGGPLEQPCTERLRPISNPVRLTKKIPCGLGLGLKISSLRWIEEGQTLPAGGR
jgi:hypothetical protein